DKRYMGTLGETLKHEREVRGVTLQEIARATRINEKYLRALEEDDFDAFHAPVFITGFLRSYAGHLGLNSDEIILRFESLKIERKEEHVPTEPIDLGDSNSIVIAAVAILCAAIGGYAIYSFMPSKADEPAFVKPAVKKVAEPSAIPAPAPQGKAKPETVEEVPAPEKQPEKKVDTEERAPAEKLKTEEPLKEETATEPPAKPVKEVKVEIRRDQKPKLKPQPGAQSPAKRKAKAKKAGSVPARAEKPPATRKKQTRSVYKYNLVIRAGEKDAWILVVIDNQIVKDMFVRAGNSILLRGNKGFNFSTGNAEHVTLTLNGMGIPVEVPPSNIIRNWRLPIPGNE
ncbi:MAG: RodZ domain-containing protein, partial [Nitrospinota bacterium]